MFKKLERRFTIVAVSAISLVLLFLVLAVQLISININIKKADIILSALAAEEGLNVETNSDFFGSKNNLIGSLDFESFRSFSVTLEIKDEIDTAEVKNLRFIEENIAIEMAHYAIEDNEVNGFVDNYRYLVIQETDVTKVFFLEYSYEQRSASILLWVSLAMYGLSVVMVIFLVKLFMKPVMKPIKESYVKQKQFITDASHELKTPLTVIVTDLQLVEMETGSSKWTKSINKQVKRLTTLSNELVELSRMDEKANTLELKDIGLSDLVCDVVYGFEPAVLANGRKLETDIDEGIRICGNYDAIEKVMFILMENALKYSDKDGEILVKLNRQNKGIVLSVENTVRYIDEGSHNEYFERFYRADKSRNTNTGGFGIGLAVAKAIVDQHRWKVEAYSPDEERIIIDIKIS